jgi:hypothetical protein
MKTQSLKNSEPSDPVEEAAEPLSAEELLRNLLQDLIMDNPTEDLAGEFVEEFILQDRAETPQMVAMMDAPSEALVEGLKAVVVESSQKQLQALEMKGVRFVDQLKADIRKRMEAVASGH